MLVAVGFLLGFSLIVSILAPFLLLENDRLEPSLIFKDYQELELEMNRLLKKFLKSEEDFKRNFLSHREWRSEKEKLTHLYLRLAKEHDRIIQRKKNKL